MQIMFHLQKGLFLRAICQVHYPRNAFKYPINQSIQKHLQIHIFANARASLLLLPSQLIQDFKLLVWVLCKFSIVSILIVIIYLLRAENCFHDVDVNISYRVSWLYSTQDNSRRQIIQPVVFVYLWYIYLSGSLFISNETVSVLQSPQLLTFKKDMLSL